jgi:predicted ArsR family transcriptional regulator
MSAPLKLTPREAKTILNANQSNMDSRAKRILQKVVDKRPLSDDEIGELEGIVVIETLVARVAENLEVPPEIAIGTATTIKCAMNKSERELQIIEARNRRKIVVELRAQHPPVPIREIAKRLGVNADTICEDLKKLRKQHEKVLDGVDTLKILGQTVEQYDIMHGKALAWADAFSSPMAKAALLRTAISALDSKSRLMAETGIIHKVPQRQEILVAHADAGTVRERVAKLIRAQEDRSGDVLELAPVSEELVDTDLKEEDDDSET